MFLPGNIRKELSYLYKARIRRPGLSDYAILLLVLGVFRNALDLSRTSQDPLALQVNAIHAAEQGHTPKPESMPKISPTIHKAMEYLQILCPEDETSSRRTNLKTATLHHYHTIGIVLGIPLGELFCYLGYRVTSLDVARCQQRLKAWIQLNDQDARQVAFHAGRLFGHLRNSNMHGYWEGRAMFTACLSLWVYSENTGPELTNEEISSKPTIRLDQPLSGEIKQSWFQAGQEMRPALAGVGSISGPAGVTRLVQEGSRVLNMSSIWPICQVQGEALCIFHKLRSAGG